MVVGKYVVLIIVKVAQTVHLCLVEVGQGSPHYSQYQSPEDSRLWEWTLWNCPKLSEGIGMP